MTGTLEKLLERIQNGLAAPEEVARARELVAGDARLPEELREIGLTDVNDLVGDAVGLLAVLGAAPLFGEALREALNDDAVGALAAVAVNVVDDGEDADWLHIAEVLREGLVAESVGFEVVEGVMARLPAPEWVYGPVTAEAVHSEAGAVDVAPDAMAALGAALPPVAEAVWSEAGGVDVVDSVLSELGIARIEVAEAVAFEAGEVELVSLVLAALSIEVTPLAEAVHNEAGDVDVADAVCASLGHDVSSVADAVREEAGSVDVSGAVFSGPAASNTALPSVVQAPPALPAPANRGWTWGAMVMAAVALLTVGLSQVPFGSSPTGTEMQFAGAGELVIEELEFADDVVVMQAEGDEGAVILWMEDV